jgi:hypothetical protein
MKGGILVSAAGLGAVVWLGVEGSLPRAAAFPPYLTAWQDRYPTSTIPQRMQATLGSACYTCHVPPSLSEEGTCYRLELRDLLYNTPMSIAEAIDFLDGEDSDGDGVPNGVEILTPRGGGEIGYHPGLIGAAGTSPCGPNPTAAVTGVLETPPGACYPNCDGSTVEPILNVADFSCFLGKFAAGDPYANCDGSTIEPVLNVADFSCFLGKFAAGCR